MRVTRTICTSAAILLLAGLLAIAGPVPDATEGVGSEATDASSETYARESVAGSIEAPASTPVEPPPATPVGLGGPPPACISGSNGSCPSGCYLGPICTNNAVDTGYSSCTDPAGRLWSCLGHQTVHIEACYCEGSCEMSSAYKVVGCL